MIWRLPASFLALIFEGIPFVLQGSLISGVIAAFIPSRVITGLLPKNRFAAILISGLLGIVFPVCECGIVPIVRRLLQKGFTSFLWGNLHARRSDRESDCHLQHAFCLPRSDTGVALPMLVQSMFRSRSQVRSISRICNGLE